MSAEFYYYNTTEDVLDIFNASAIDMWFACGVQHREGDRLFAIMIVIWQVMLRPAESMPPSPSLPSSIDLYLVIPVTRFVR